MTTCPKCGYTMDRFGRCWRCEPRKVPVSGIQLAGLTNPAHAEAISAMKEQLLIVMLKRLGGKLEVPVHEIDNTDGDNLGMRLDAQSLTFHFEIVRSPA